MRENYARIPMHGSAPERFKPTHLEYVPYKSRVGKTKWWTHERAKSMNGETEGHEHTYLTVSVYEVVLQKSVPAAGMDLHKVT